MTIATSADNKHPPSHHLRLVEESGMSPGGLDITDISSGLLAEQSMLGSMLLDPRVIDEVTAEASPADHLRPEHETIHRTILNLRDAGCAVDCLTLAEELRRTGEFLRVGGAAYLHTLIANVHIPANGVAHARIVRDHARLRVAESIGAKLSQLGRAGDVAKVDAYLGEAVQALDDAAMRFGPVSAAATGLHDLAWLLGGALPAVPSPTVLRRKDDTALFYAGKVNGIFGDPECGKTWVAQAAIVEALNSGGTAAIVDVDHNGADHTATRLRLLGGRVMDLADPRRFRYYEPQDDRELRAAVKELTSWGPTVTLVDSLGEVFPMLEVNSNDGDEITMAMREICARPADAGSCVITIDHLPKSGEARSTGYAIGSIAKKRMVRGSYLRAEAQVQPTPGEVGRITLRIEKDTAGELRKASGGGFAGTFILDSTDDQSLGWEISREVVSRRDAPRASSGLQERISAFVETHAGCTQNEIEDAVEGSATNVRKALKALVADGHLVRDRGPRNSWLHAMASPYRENGEDRERIIP